MTLAPGESYKEVDLIGGQDFDAEAGFILAEEAALRKYLSGLTVPKFSQGKPTGEFSAVPVYFRWPTSERNISYPYITIDLLSIDPAYTRWTSWYNPANKPITYEEEGRPGHGVRGFYYPDQAGHIKPDKDTDVYGYHTGPYLPYDMLFQISVFARSLHHDRFLTSRMFTDFLSQRNFWVSTDVDDVWHRCETMGFVSGDSMETMEATKRQFRKIYTVRMETEVPSEKLYELRRVRRVRIKTFDEEDYMVDEFTIPETT